MDIAIHVAAAAVTCQAALYLDARTPDPSLSARRPYLFGTGCFALGILSHLALDTIPHCNMLYSIGNSLLPDFFPESLWKLLKVGICIPPLILWFLFLARDHPKFVLAALAGGLYPDFEKGAYLATLLPRSFVLFPFHSYSYSSSGWEVKYRHVLIVAEIGLLSGLLALMHWFGQKHRTQHPGPNSSFKAWYREIRLHLRSFAGTILEKTVCRFSVQQLTIIYFFSLITIFVLSDTGWPQHVQTELYMYVPQVWGKHLPSRLPYDDKIAHFLMMGMLALLANLSLHISAFKIPRMNILKGSVFVLTFATLEEGSQLFFSARTFSWGDLMASYLGVICADVLLRYLIHHRQVAEKRLPTILAKMVYQQSQQ
ncbi:hypothetical protein U27_02064 [Candidatus Vecturithrix granuli]|uniref:VanZ-like domain-containing protein n=1 Tax=Vecturithrix granuli TaxID=1499967 RepID=A0A0S6W6H0_VECG1|nr:hypothetical protein U27_02064 [Candidatus Vecturithrix granuli]